MGIRLLKEGLHTTVQDRGRFGYRSSGVPVSGAMDDRSSKLANWIVGNKGNEATIEVTLLGPQIHFEEDAVISVAGKGFDVAVEDTFYKLFQPIAVKKGQKVSIHSNRDACRAYIAIQGGINLSAVLNSVSTFVRGGFGGLNGTVLAVGDHLSIEPLMRKPKTRWFVPPCHYQDWMNTETIRFVKGNQASWFSEEVYSSFISNPFTVSPQSDRMGYRLKGLELIKSRQQELVTEGTTVGTIQVPPNGQPIILMKDGQVTGGYPKIGTVISADIPVLGQKRPGDVLHFQEVSMDEALEAKRASNLQMERLAKKIALQWREN